MNRHYTEPVKYSFLSVETWESYVTTRTWSPDYGGFSHEKGHQYAMRTFPRPFFDHSTAGPTNSAIMVDHNHEDTCTYLRSTTRGAYNSSAQRAPYSPVSVPIYKVTFPLLVTPSFTIQVCISYYIFVFYSVYSFMHRWGSILYEVERFSVDKVPCRYRFLMASSVVFQSLEWRNGAPMLRYSKWGEVQTNNQVI